MIGYLHGKITFLAVDFCFVDVNGVGYRVFITAPARSRLSLNQEVKLYTYLSVREDAMLLYGFLQQTEYNLFCKLISVSKIGPKAGMGLLSALPCEKLIWAIQNKQASLLTNAPGIGKKTAERIVLELKDKLADLNVEAIMPEEPVLIDMPPEDISTDKFAEAGEALTALGYTKAEISAVLKKCTGISTTEEIIKFALKELSLK